MKKTNLLCRTFWAMILGGCSTGLQADDYGWFRLVSDGETVEWPVAALRKITFSFDGNMHVETGSGVRSFSCAALEKMYFAGQSTGMVSQVTYGRIQQVAPYAVAFPPTAAGGQVEVFRADGIRVRSFRIGPAGGTFVLEGLSRGIYVIRFAGQTLKFICS